MRRARSTSWRNYKTPYRNIRRSAKLEQSLIPRALAAPQVQKRDKGYCGKGYILRFICYRKRLIDYSNLCVKWIEDSIVEAGIIPDDGPTIVKKIELIQVKSKNPRTVVEIFEIQ